MKCAQRELSHVLSVWTGGRMGINLFTSVIFVFIVTAPMSLCSLIYSAVTPIILCSHGLYASHQISGET